jgi:hypothetical protein
MIGAVALKRLRWACAPALLAAWVLMPASGTAQKLRPNEREARPGINVQDKEDIRVENSKIWVLDFMFYDPRLITVDIPGRGRRLCWYMKYRIINHAKDHQPHDFIPKFELVTIDKPGVYEDQILPKVQDAIRQIEDPTGYLDIKNSVTISGKPIPWSTDDIPRPVYGVAIWDDVNPDANRFSIFVSGLSNGWALAEVPPDNKQVVRKKTLQLNFKRLGDKYLMHEDEIHFVPPAEWIYRATPVTVPNGKQEAPAKK